MNSRKIDASGLVVKKTAGIFIDQSMLLASCDRKIVDESATISDTSFEDCSVSGTSKGSAVNCRRTDSIQSNISNGQTMQHYNSRSHVM